MGKNGPFDLPRTINQKHGGYTGYIGYDSPITLLYLNILCNLEVATLVSRGYNRWDGPRFGCGFMIQRSEPGDLSPGQKSHDAPPLPLSSKKKCPRVLGSYEPQFGCYIGCTCYRLLNYLIFLAITCNRKVTIPFPACCMCR